MNNQSLENNEPIHHNKKKTSTKKKIIIGIIVSSLVGLLVILLVFLIPTYRYKDDRSYKKVPKPINVVVMIGDGFGPASATLARAVLKEKFQRTSLNLDKHLVGTVRTSSSDSLITDSAASGTAFATGMKGKNGAISTDPYNNKPLGTIFEAAQDVGINTGIVVTGSLSDATPASFYAHSIDRNYQEFITSQMLTKNLTVALGGGALSFDKVSLITATNNNYSIARNREDLMRIRDGKVLGLFADKQMPFEIDRINQNIDVPTLSEMTSKSLNLINQNNHNGFILVVEGSLMDDSSHSNDAAGHAWEAIQFDQAFQTVVDFAKNDGNTLVLVTSNHETGGITLGMQNDPTMAPQKDWHPEELIKFNVSVNYMANQLLNTTIFPKINESIISDYVNYVSKDLKLNFTSDELAVLMSFTNSSDSTSVAGFKKNLGKFLSKRANIGFSTNQNTGVDVNLYYYYTGKDKEILENPLKGNIENIEICNYLAKVMKLDIIYQTIKYSNFIPHP